MNFFKVIILTFISLLLASNVFGDNHDTTEKELLEKAKEINQKVKLDQENSISDAKSNAALIVKDVIEKTNHSIRENQAEAKERFQKKMESFSPVYSCFCGRHGPFTIS